MTAKEKNGRIVSTWPPEKLWESKNCGHEQCRDDEGRYDACTFDERED